MKKLLLMLSVFLWSGLQLAMAQSRPVRGKVLDDKGQGVPAASVQVKGTQTGTITDVDGNFQLDVPDENNTLVIEAIGFGTKEVAAGDGDNTVTVSLVQSSQSLDETVVIGYATVKRKDLTGSVSKVSSEEISSIPNVTVEKALQGRAAGVQVVQNSGAPGAGIDVRVRGTTSLNAGTQPLYVIDGVPVTTGSVTQMDVGGQGTNALAQLNPNDIESMEVLKDAATAAMYGARAANGVVLITTKKGRYSQDGYSTIQLNTSYGVQNTWKKIKTLNNNQYYDLIGDEVRNAAGDQTITNEDAFSILELPQRPEYYTNFIDYIFDQGVLQDHNVSLNGGSSKTKYFASFGYFQNKGILRASQYDRYTGRLNIETKVSDKIKVGANMSYANTNEQRVRNDNNIYGYLLPSMLLPPDEPLKNKDGTYWINDFGWENPAANAEVYINNVKTNRFIGNTFAEISIVKGLSLRSTFGGDILDSREKVYEPVTTASGRGSNGSATAATFNYTSWINEDYLTYINTFGKHSLNIVGGISFQQDRSYQTAAQGTNAASPDLTNVGTTAVPVTASSSGTVYGLRSYFFNANYNFGDRYLAGVSLRSDASSRFPEGNRYATFPGASVAWRISEEEFMKDAKPVISDMKFRIGYGSTGNQNIGNFASRLLYGTQQYADAIGVFYSQLDNQNLKWETTNQLNFAIDLGLLNNRINLTAEYYYRKTNNMLLNRPYATQTGFTSRLENIGEMENKGWEITINSQNVKGKFNWNTTLNISQNKNKVLKLYEGRDLLLGFSGTTIVREGESIGSFYGWQVEKIFQSSEEVDAANAGSPTGTYQNASTAAGDFKFVDQNGDGRITDADRTILGSAQPTVFGGIGNNFSWKGFELDIFCQFSLGNKMFNANRQYTNGMNGIFNQTEEVLDRWTPTNTNTDVPRAILNDPNDNARNSSFYVENASYFRIKNITLAYSFSAESLKFSNNILKGLRLYVTSANLLTFTKYKGFDPEVNTFDGSSSVLGTDFGTYPQARSFIFGANFTF